MGLIVSRSLTVLALLLAVTANVQAHVPHDVIADVAASPAFSQDHTAFAIVRETLLKTDDGGMVWRRVSRGLGRDFLTAIAISANFAADGTMFVASNRGEVFRSTDRGNSFALAGSLSRQSIQQLAVTPGEGGQFTLYALDATGKLHRSRDGASSWKRICGRARNITALAVQSERLAVGTETGILHLSEDKGDSWTRVGGSGTADRITVISIPEPDSPGSHILMGTASLGLFRLAARGQDIEPASADFGERAVTGMARQRMGGQESLLVSTHQEALFRSTDDGHSWTQHSQGLLKNTQADTYDEPHFTRIEVADGGTILAAGFSGLFMSQDGGQSFTELDTLLGEIIVGLDVAHVSATDVDVSVATYSSGLYSSASDQEDWRVHSRLPSGRRLGAMSYSPNFAEDGTLFAASFWFVLKSTDRGSSWSRISLAKLKATAKPGEHRAEDSFLFPLMFAISPEFADDGTVFASLFPTGLLRSADGGASFQLLDDFPVERLRYVVVSPQYGSDRTVFAAGLQGLYRSTDGGEDWTRLEADIDLRSSAIALSPGFAEDQTLFAGNASGLHRSQDGGATWQSLELSDDQTPVQVAAVALSPGFSSDRELVVQVTGGDFLLCQDLIDGFRFRPGGRFDGALEFSHMRGFVRETVPLIKYSPHYSRDQTLYAASYTSLLRSRDGGQSFQVMDRPVRYESSENPVRHRYTWTSEPGTQYSAWKTVHSDRAGTVLNFTFVGTGVTWIGSTGPDHGIALVSVDGKKPVMIDQYATEAQYKVETFRVDQLPPGRHTIRVTVSGKSREAASAARVDVDAFDVIR